MNFNLRNLLSSVVPQTYENFNNHATTLGLCCLYSAERNSQVLVLSVK